MSGNKEYEESSCHYESDNPAETTSLPSTPTTSSVVYRINRFRSRFQILLGKFWSQFYPEIGGNFELIGCFDISELKWTK